MNIDRLISMVVRTLVNRGVNAGINKGSQLLAGRGKRPEDMTDEERESAASLQRGGNQVRRMMRMGRRMR